jgi:uncharacterized protein YqhQ
MLRQMLQVGTICHLGLTAEEPRIGGQAVIEGVMMRDPSGWAVAVRTPDGSVKRRLEKKSSYASRHRWARIPLARGAVVLVESVAVGFRALSWSADIYASETARPGPTSAARRDPTRRNDLADSGSGVVSMIAALIFAITLFVIIPAVLARVLLSKLIDSSLALSASEGLIRIVILVGYIGAVSRLPEVRRVFEYHGAEHQTIAAFEGGDPLDSEHIAAYSTKHPRCGTSFLLIVMIVTIAIYSVIRGSLSLPLQLAARIALLPLVAGISYELIRFGWAHRKRWAAKILMLPGLALQGITTRIPDDAQIEVAITSLKTLIGIGAAADDGTEERLSQDEK